MRPSRTARARPAPRPSAARERPSGNVFSAFVRTLEKLESARAAARPAREGRG
jgi:hypothetical protein